MKIGKTLRRIWWGIGYLDGLGHHPGNVILATMTVAGAVAGYRGGGGPGAVFGVGVIAVTLGVVYLFGAYSRGRAYERSIYIFDPDE